VGGARWCGRLGDRAGHCGRVAGRMGSASGCCPARCPGRGCSRSPPAGALAPRERDRSCRRANPIRARPRCCWAECGMSAPTRPLSRTEHEAFRLARLVAAERAPYFMHALFAAAPVAAPGLGTFAVDGAWRLYMDPELLVGPSKWDSPTAAAVLLHEVGHLLRDHAGRAEALPRPRHHLAWNLAGDAEINDDLLAAGVPLPEGVVTPAALGCEDGDLAETYYATLVPPDGSAPALPDDGGAGCGSGSGCPSVPGELPEGVSLSDGSAEPLSPAEGEFVCCRGAHAVVVSTVVDTSGAMSQADLDAAMAEVHGVLHSTGVARERVRLLSCDAAATTAQRVRSAVSVRLTGGGGTDMRVGIRAAEKATPAPHVVIVLTDGDTPWPETPTRARLVCAVISTRQPSGTPAWASTVHIPPAKAV